jgi:hypothetical protein
VLQEIAARLQISRIAVFHHNRLPCRRACGIIPAICLPLSLSDHDARVLSSSNAARLPKIEEFERQSGMTIMNWASAASKMGQIHEGIRYNQ